MNRRWFRLRLSGPIGRFIHPRTERESRERTIRKQTRQSHLSCQQKEQRRCENPPAPDERTAQTDGRWLFYDGQFRARPRLRQFRLEVVAKKVVYPFRTSIRALHMGDRLMEHFHGIGKTPWAVKRSANRCRARLKRMWTAVEEIASALAISLV